MNLKISRALLISALAFLAPVLLLVWLFSREGTLGLFVWHTYRPLFIGIGISAFVPAVLLGLAELGRQKARMGAFFRMASVVAGLMVTLFSGALFAALFFISTSSATSIPSLNLVNPAAGLMAQDSVQGSAQDNVQGSSPALRLSFSSDAHWGKDKSNASARSAIIASVANASPRKDAFFVLGDLTELGMFGSQMRAAAEGLASGLKGIPVRPLLGNHDGLINGQKHFIDYFFPSSLSSDSDSPFYYSIQAGPAVIIVLNLTWGTESFTGAQKAWLIKTLDKVESGRPIIVLSHSFFYSSGYTDEETGMPWYDHADNLHLVEPLLRAKGVDLVISGHNHYMELLEAHGTTYAVIGAMGGFPDPESTYKSPASLWFSRNTFGRLDLDIYQDRLDLRFVDEKGVVLKEHSVGVN